MNKQPPLPTLAQRPGLPRVRVHIDGRDNFHGVLIGQTDTHYLVAWEPGGLMGEWFAKRAARVECLALDQSPEAQP